MKKKIAVLSVPIVLASLAFAPLVSGHPTRGLRRGIHSEQKAAGGGVFRHLGRLRETLELTGEQLGNIRVIATELRAQNAPLRETLRKHRGAAAQVLLSNPDNVAEAKAALDEQAAVRERIRENGLRATARALAVLSPQQRETLRGLLESRRRVHLPSKE